MKIYDITLPISPDLPVWPGEPAVVLEKVSSMDAGAHDNVSRLACGVHTGTHVDAPHHFMNDHRTVEALALDLLVGPAQVIQIPQEVKVVSADILEKAVTACLFEGLNKLNSAGQAQAATHDTLLSSAAKHTETAAPPLKPSSARKERSTSGMAHR